MQKTVMVQFLFKGVLNVSHKSMITDKRISGSNKFYIKGAEPKVFMRQQVTKLRK